MKLITAVIHPALFESVRDALEAFDIHGLTVSAADEHNRFQPRAKIFRGLRYWDELSPKLRLEVLLTDSDSADALRVIVAASTTHDGARAKIWVTPVDEALGMQTVPWHPPV